MEPAEAGDIDVLAHMIAHAFFYLACRNGWFPDPAACRANFPGYFRLAVEHAITAGAVHTTPDRSAAALWITVGEYDDLRLADG